MFSFAKFYDLVYTFRARWQAYKDMGVRII